MPSAAGIELPPRGEGRTGDRAIQNVLEQTWPKDLPPAAEQELLAAGRALLLADTTGVGRDKWPTVFGSPREGDAGVVAPAFSRLRVQAAIARRSTRPGRAVVHLVWAGADRGGTYADGRISDFVFTQQKGTDTWAPLPRR
ncbi:hypothetical protein P8605_14240 [Streptomyces sp. T-3]|nr:hypothetical protein [Streptomyces sp. T-3]